MNFRFEKICFDINIILDLIFRQNESCLNSIIEVVFVDVSLLVNSREVSEVLDNFTNPFQTFSRIIKQALDVFEDEVNFRRLPGFLYGPCFAQQFRFFRIFNCSNELVIHFKKVIDFLYVIFQRLKIAGGKAH